MRSLRPLPTNPSGHGQLREPLLKVIQLLQSLEVAKTDDLPISLVGMDHKIGQAPFEYPSVFNFYLPEFAPEGAVADAGLVAPEAQLATAPNLVGYLGLHGIGIW